MKLWFQGRNEMASFDLTLLILGHKNIRSMNVPDGIAGVECLYVDKHGA